MSKRPRGDVAVSTPAGPVASGAAKSDPDAPSHAGRPIKLARMDIIDELGENCAAGGLVGCFNCGEFFAEASFSLAAVAATSDLPAGTAESVSDALASLRTAVFGEVRRRCVPDPSAGSAAVIASVEPLNRGLAVEAADLEREAAALGPAVERYRNEVGVMGDGGGGVELGSVRGAPLPTATKSAARGCAARGGQAALCHS